MGCHPKSLCSYLNHRTINIKRINLINLYGVSFILVVILSLQDYFLKVLYSMNLYLQWFLMLYFRMELTVIFQTIVHTLVDGGQGFI